MSKPIVDLHCHYIASQPNAVENFRRLVDAPEVHRIAVCALDLKLNYSSAWPFMSMFATTNEQLAQFIEQLDSPKLAPWCHIDPLSQEPEKQADYWINQRGMKGIKMYPPSGWYPNDPRALPVYHFAQEHNIPILMHMGRVATHPQLRSEYARPIYLEEVGIACPNLKLIIGHFASPWSREAMHISMSFPHFYFDLTTSGSWETAVLKQAAEEEWVGQYRIVLGTDGDGSNNLELAYATVDRLRKAGFTEAQLDAFAHENGLAVLV